MIKISKSAAETKNIAAALAKKLPGPDKRGALIVALEGELGAGKTIFMKGFAKALGVKENISSPTFVLLKSYDLKAKDFSRLIHVDAYRLNDEKDLQNLGFLELLENQANIIAVEWPDRINKILPKRTIIIRLIHIGKERRQIEIELAK